MNVSFNKKKRNPGKYWILLLVLFLLVLILFRFDLLNTEEEPVSENERFELFCDMESIESDQIIAGDFRLYGADQRSDDMALSGSYSVKLDKENRFGLNFILEEIIPSKRYKVSVWSKNPHPCTAHLVVSAEDSDMFYTSKSKVVERNGDFWNRRELSFQIPDDPDFDKLKIYVYKDDSESVIYFDDLEIREVDALNSFTDLSFDHYELNLFIDKAGLDYLEEMKDRSISQGVIYHDDSKIKVKINDEGKDKEAKLRLKGDWLDHISGYPSYRIDMNDEESWNGMQSFSVQEPNTRGLIRNWVFFKFLDHADIIRPRADFIRMRLNNGEAFIFSFEEHFTKNLVENRDRREGPIVKLTEDRIWDITKRYFNSFNQSLPGMEEKDKTYWRSEIKAFKEGKIMNNLKLKNDFEIAQNLMHQFKYDLKPASEIFDIHRLARYLALVDICLAKHAITWHNQRFYYNPVTAVLEPIGFDAYTDKDPNDYADDVLSEAVYDSQDFPHEPLEQLLYDDEFAELYFDYLVRYSDPEFIQSMLDELEEGIRSREDFLNIRFKNYRYDREEILDKAKKIRIGLEPHVNSLLAFRSEELRRLDSLKLFNHHGAPLKILLEDEGGDHLIIYPFNLDLNPEPSIIAFSSSRTEIKYQVVGFDEIHRSSVSEYNDPQDFSPRQELGRGNHQEFSELFEDNPLKCVLKKGKHTIDRPLIIPSGRDLLINAGTELVFEGGGFILSYSPVRILGNEEEPILISSSDGQHGSFTVMQADGNSELRHVRFENQNTLNYKNWMLTGAVNFYESDVDMEAVQFVSNNCEDALNIIRSDFEIRLCSFLDTYGDAFDSDFCTGEINSCLYRRSGNDAIDASGSKLSIINCTIETAGDKGISGGEMSKISVVDCRISQANIGLASKDRSELLVDGLVLNDCKTGITAYQKKPEFGPASIRLSNCTMENIEREFMIEQGSELIR